MPAATWATCSATCPGQPGYNKRLRRATVLITTMVRADPDSRLGELLVRKVTSSRTAACVDSWRHRPAG